jgi:hypothetical protein
MLQQMRKRQREREKNFWASRSLQFRELLEGDRRVWNSSEFRCTHSMTAKRRVITWMGLEKPGRYKIISWLG